MITTFGRVNVITIGQKPQSSLSPIPLPPMLLQFSLYVSSPTLFLFFPFFWSARPRQSFSSRSWFLLPPSRGDFFLSPCLLTMSSISRYGCLRFFVLHCPFAQSSRYFKGNPTCSPLCPVFDVSPHSFALFSPTTIIVCVFLD